MKIVHVVSTFPPYQAGTGNVCFYNCRDLARRGHDVHVFTAQTDGAPDEEMIDGVHVHRLRALIRLGNAPLLPALLSLDHFDLVHLHFPFIFGAELLSLICRLRRIPYVLTYHNDLTGSGFRKLLFYTYTALVTRFVFNGAERLMCVSKDYAEHSAAASLIKAHKHSLIEMPNGVDTDHFQSKVDGRRVREKFQIDPSAGVMIFIGALDRAHYFKGVDVLVRAFAMIDDANARLLIVGGGDLEQTYRELALALGTGDRIIFAGRIQHDHLPEYLSASDALILPSTSTESFGLVLIEAMACSKPVIATNLPGVRTVVSGDVGILVPAHDVLALADAMRLLIADRALCDRLGAAGRLKVEQRYDWRRIGESLEAAYSDIFK